MELACGFQHVIEIVGKNMPGRRCGPNPQGEMYENIHVGMRNGREVVDLVPGDAPSAPWLIDVVTRTPARTSVARSCTVGQATLTARRTCWPSAPHGKSGRRRVRLGGTRLRPRLG